MSRPITYMPGQVVLETVHSAIVADVTLANARKIACAGAKAIVLAMTNAATNNRSWAATVEVSFDNGTTWTAYNMLITNQADTSAEDEVHSASLVNAANGSKIAFFDPKTLGAVTHFRVGMTKTDGGSPAGNATVQATIQT